MKIKKIRQKRTNQKINGKKVNYEDFGITELCFRCGRNNHWAKENSTKKDEFKCPIGNKNGHVSKVCISSLKMNAMVRSHNNLDQIQSIQHEDCDVYKIIDVYQNNFRNSNSERYYANINKGKPVKFKVDSGSGFTFLPK